MTHQVKESMPILAPDDFFHNKNWIRTIYHGMIDGIIIFDHEGRIMSVNPAGEAVIGRLKRDVIGERRFGMPEVEKLIAASDPVPAADKVKCWQVKRCTHPDCPSYNSDDLRCWLRCGTYCHNQIQGTFQQKRDACERCDVYTHNGIRCIEVEKNGQQFTAQISPILDENAKEQGRMVLFHNITDLRHAEQKVIRRNEALMRLQQQNNRLFKKVEKAKREWEATFDAMTDMASVHDTDFNIIRANRSMMEHFGDACLGRKCCDVFNECSQNSAICPSKTAIEQRHGISIELDDPALGSVIVSIDPILSPEGEILGFVHVIKDISEQRQLRAQLLQAEKMAAVGQLVSGVAHELNNPLASIMGYTQYLLMNKDIRTGEQLHGDLEIVYSEAERAARIVKNLLSFARKHESQKKSTDINQTINNLLSLKAYELKVANIAVETELDMELPPAMLDEHQVEQALLNLINNAEQAIEEAGQEGGRVVIGTRTIGGSLEITVSDNGPGIPEDNIIRIFDPFFTTKEVGKGTGLGLSICYGIVQEHGGDIHVQSQPGQGTAFTITLPLLFGSSPSQMAAGRAVDKSHKQGGRILVVDDEASIVKLLSKTLTDRWCSVDVAQSGHEALEKLAAETFDVIVSDIKMPTMDGMEFFRHVQEMDEKLARRIIFITGDTVSADTEEFLLHCDNPVVEKPFDLGELMSIIAERLGAGNGERSGNNTRGR